MNSVNLKASVSFVGDGSTNKFYFGFDYINKQFVKVQVGADSSPLTYLHDYTVDDRSVTLTDTPAVGVTIRVYRETPSDRIVEWADGAFIKASQMTLESLQQLHLIEEAHDYPILNSLSKYPDGVNFNALSSRVVNVSDPIDPQDAVTKHYMENVQGGFVAANTKILNEAKDTLSATQQTQSKAQANETLSKAWATSTESPDNTDDAQSSTGKTQSSRSWALYSEGKAQESATSEAHAKTSETNAKTSETNAKTSETNAKDSETKAATSEANAKVSEINAKDSETKSATSEANAKVSEINAKDSETKAATSEANAKVSETNAKAWDLEAQSKVEALRHLLDIKDDIARMSDFRYIARNTAYSSGLYLYTPSLGVGYIIYVLKAGTTSSEEPNWSSIASKVSNAMLDMGADSSSLYEPDSWEDWGVSYVDGTATLLICRFDKMFSLLTRMYKRNYYTPKDSTFHFGNFYGTGYITGGGKKLYFTIPLSKPVHHSVSSVTASITNLILRGDTKYYLGAASQGVDTGSDKLPNVSAYVTDNWIYIIADIVPSPTPPSNIVVGVACDIYITFNS